MNNWQDISSAPKDGTKFLAVWQGGLRKIINWDHSPSWNDDGKKTWTDGYNAYVAPTHWQHLPPPPSEDK